MRLKQNVLDLVDKMNELLESSKNGMEKRTISPDQLYKNLKQLSIDLERAEALIKRESDQ